MATTKFSRAIRLRKRCKLFSEDQVMFMSEYEYRQRLVKLADMITEIDGFGTKIVCWVKNPRSGGCIDVSDELVALCSMFYMPFGSGYYFSPGESTAVKRGVVAHTFTRVKFIGEVEKGER